MTQCFIDGISHDGQGVGRLDGQAIFVPGALPGEIADIDIVQKRRNFARGRLNSIVEASPHRVVAPCPYYQRCGGCSYQHASYQLQSELKTKVLKQTLQRIGKVDTEVNPCLPSPQIWRYRNRVTWHGASGREGWELGYYRSNTHDILPVNDCLLVSEAMQMVSNNINRQFRNIGPLPAIELSVRESSYDKGMMAVISGLTSRQAGQLGNTGGARDLSIIHCEQQNCTALRGEPFLREKLGQIDFNISPQAFFQVNRGQAERLLDIVRGWLSLQGTETILDAYCGAGPLALNLASRVRKVIGIEAFRPAVADAKANARLNGLRNTRFLAGLAEDIMPTLTNRFDAVILDPPRSGCAPEVVQSVARLQIPRVIYVSCEPSTLARDLALFNQIGYKILGVQPLDMFPWTRHVECVVKIERS